MASWEKAKHISEFGLQNSWWFMAPAMSYTFQQRDHISCWCHHYKLPAFHGRGVLLKPPSGAAARWYCQLRPASEKINSVLKIIRILHEVNVWCNPRNNCCIRSWALLRSKWVSGIPDLTVAAIWTLSYSCFHLLAAKGMQQWCNHVGTWRIQAMNLASKLFFCILAESRHIVFPILSILDTLYKKIFFFPIISCISDLI